MNRRRLKALSKRITNKEIANQLGVSVSTIYRYKKGKVKNPKVDHKNEIDKLWNEFKNVKGTKSGKKKHKNAIRHLDYSYKGKDTFETAESVHFNYEIGTLDWSTIEGTIKDLTLNAIKKGYKNIIYFLRMKVLVDEGHEIDNKLIYELILSTPSVWYENINLLEGYINNLLQKPSAQLKAVKSIELVQIVK